MILRKFIFLLIFILSIHIHLELFARDKFTRKEVEEFVEMAVDYVKENGKKAALKEFMNPDGEFRKGMNGELYIYAYDYKGIVLSHGDKPKLVGFNLIDLKDNDGNYVIQKLIKGTTSSNHWVKYKWLNPATKKIEIKYGYVLKIDDTWWLGSGLYESEEEK